MDYVFEALENDLKIHNYLSLLDASKTVQFQHLVEDLIALVPLIKGTGVSGFMKFPYKDSKYFTAQSSLAENFLPLNPKQPIN